jgi:hypothetical protein
MVPSFYPGQIDPATLFSIYNWCTHFAWNSYTAVHQYTCTCTLCIVHTNPGARMILTNERTGRNTVMDHRDKTHA